MKKVLLTAVCFSVMALGALNVQAADDMPLPPPPPHHGDEMLPPPPPPGADKAMEKKMEKMEKRMSKKLADDLGLTKEQQEQAEKIRKEGRHHQRHRDHRRGCAQSGRWRQHRRRGDPQ